MMLLVMIGFASILYWSVERSARLQMDTRLEGAVRYLDAALRPFPLRELLRTTPFAPSFGTPGGSMRDGAIFSSKEGSTRGAREGSRETNEKRTTPEVKGQPPGRTEGKSPGERPNDRPGERNQSDRRYNPMREAERLKRELGLRSTTDTDSGRPPIFYTIFKQDGTVFKTQDDPLVNRSYASLDERLGDSREPIFYDAVAKRQVIFRGPERSIILAGVSQIQEVSQLRTLLYQVLGSGSLALVVGLIGSWYISGKMMEPLKIISTTASNISATNLAERIDTTNLDAELVELTTALNASLDRLEAAFQRQSRFTADAGHELRTPLAILHTNLELALSRPRKEEEFREIITYCLQSSSKMRSLIDALLMLARADAGQLQANFIPLDLRSVVQTSIQQHLSKAKNILLDARLPDQPVMIMGDPTLLGMVLSNLIQNALRHTHDEGHVQVSVEMMDKKATMVVSDNGIGIPLEAQPLIFERFYRVDASRNRHTGGHGLGLAICKSLVETHHGTIACESKPGEGSRFIMCFPLVVPE